MKKIYFALIIIFSMFASAVSAEGETQSEKISAFKSAKIVGDLSIQVPTVIEVPFNQEVLTNEIFAVVEIQSDKFQPYYFYQKNNHVEIYAEIKSGQKASSNLVDNNYKSFVDFFLPEEGQGEAEVLLKGASAVTSSRLVINLDRNVALPTQVEIRADEVVVFAKSKISSSVISFPETKARNWQIKMWYAQPLRITELTLSQENSANEAIRGLRFLARPNMNYAVYFNPDRNVEIISGEAGNLRSDKDVLKTKSYVSSANFFYKEADVDKDGIADKFDNCVNVANPKQEDIDANGRGDACDDFDRDGIINSKDNCVDQPNSNQSDTDADRIGDACDGEENRVTEKYPWLPWVGMGFVVLVIGGMTLLTWKGKKVN